MPENLSTIAISGAGSGLGEALAYRFAKVGYLVAVTDAIRERADTVLSNIVEAGGKGFSQQLDVTQQADWESLSQRVQADWGHLDVLVNNAGVAAAGRLEDSPIEDWQWVLDINLMGVIRGCHSFVPVLREQGKGHIVNVASLAGLMPVPELSAYATAKAGVVAVSEQLRVDLAGSGVGISLLCPAYVQTGLLETFRSRNAHHQKQAARWMARSKVSAADVADMVFNGVARNRFLLHTHAESRWLLRFKRWFPQLLHRSFVRAKNQLEKKSVS